MFSIFVLPVCLTYWPRKYTTHVDPHIDNSHQVWSWYYHLLRVIAFLSAHTSRDLVTLNSWCAWWVTWLTLPPSLNTLCLSVLDLSVITFSFGYHWECVRSHCTYAESRDPWVGGQNNYIFGIPNSDLSIHYTTSLGLRRRLRVVYSRASPFLKPLIA